MKIYILLALAFICSCSTFPSEKELEKISKKIELPVSVKKDQALIYVLSLPRFSGYTQERCFYLITATSREKKDCNIVRDFFFFYQSSGEYIAETKM